MRWAIAGTSLYTTIDFYILHNSASLSKTLEIYGAAFPNNWCYEKSNDIILPFLKIVGTHLSNTSSLSSTDMKDMS